MANYYSTCRSNYFKIGRPKDFLEWVESMPDLVFSSKDKQTEDPKDLVGMVYVDNPDGAGWPTYRYMKYEEGEYDDEVDIDFFQELSEFLAPGEVAIFMEVGAEKLRYLSGYACAVNSDGDFLQVTLNDIYDKVRQEWGVEDVSAAEY